MMNNHHTKESNPVSIRKKDNPNDLTEEEIAFLRTTSVPGEVRTYLARQHENIGTKISAYRKVAAAARAEVDALFAVRDLANLNDELTTVAEARQRLATLEATVSQTQRAIGSRDAEIRRLTAAPAAVVHSND